MDITRIIAIRHGETAWNVDTRIQGHLDIPLNDMGIWQAQCAAKALAQEPIQAIYTSDLRRASQTAEAIGQAAGVPAVAHAGLRERAFGRFQGHTFAQIEANHPEDALRWRQRDPHWRPEGGESLLALRERIQQTVEELARAHSGGLIVLVAHGGVMDVLYRQATHLELQAPRTWVLANAALNRLLWSPEGLSLVGWGDTHHLEASRDETTA